MSASVLVVGAGVAGVACGRALQDAGVGVRVLDRGRAVGGRACTRALHGRRVDLGASYLTARDPGFRAVVDDWVARGLARPWTPVFDVARADGWTRTGDGPVRYGTPLGLRSLVEDLAGPLDVRSGVDVEAVGAGPLVARERWDAVVLAMPDPQALDLLADDLPEERAAVEGRAWQPALSFAAGFEARTWVVDGVFVHPEHPSGAVLSWAADDGARRGDGAPVLVAHSTAELARTHLDDPQAAEPVLVEALRALLDLPAPLWTHVHRWSLASPSGSREQAFHLGPARVGLCGDGWGSPRFETAWVSGTALGTELARQLSD